MATGEHHINTYLTSAELDALIGSEALERGNYYYDTDKDWYLLAISPSKLIPVGGKLTINNGDTLPTGIEPDILMVDTGVIDYDINISTPLILSEVYSGYLLSGAYVTCLSSDVDGILEFYVNGSLSTTDIISPNSSVVLYGKSNNIWDGSITIYAVGIGSDNTTARAIIELHKSPFA